MVTTLQYVMYVRFCGWRHAFIPRDQWQNQAELMFRSSPGGGTSQTTTVFGWVRQNAAPGAKSAIYDCLVTACVWLRYIYGLKMDYVSRPGRLTPGYATHF